MIGQTLSHFRISAKLGEGGMGEVYRAEDTSLDRDVAIKVLPEALKQEPERLARFEREAKVLAALNHPNIAAIHQIQEDAGTLFLVMELVDGEDLAQRMSGGPIPWEEAVGYAIQIATGLEAAHQRGIVHRDLKPANVRITPAGQVKILDFGLAKTWEKPSDASPDLSLSPTLTAEMTGVGVILGTAGYMSPEQARGQEADQRSDIWALGVILWEMLHGRRLFQEPTVSDTLAAVLRGEIDSGLPEGAPWLLGRLVDRCLRRAAEQRLHSAADLRIELAQIRDGDLGPKVSSRPESVGPVSRHPLVSVLLAIVLGFIGLAIWSGRGDQGAAAVRRVSLTLPAGMVVTSTPELSPDGTSVVFVADNRLYLRRLDEFEPRELAGNEGACEPTFSPDGAWIAYIASGRLWKVPATGGTPRPIADALECFGISWIDNDSLVFVPSLNGGLHRVSAAGGTAEVLITPDGQSDYAFAWPSATPGGREIVFAVWGGQPATGVLSLDDMTWSKLDITTWISPHRLPSGHLVFGDEDSSGLAALPPDLAGAPVLMEESVQTIPRRGRSLFSVSADGTLVFAPGNPSRRSLVWVDLAGSATEAVTGQDRYAFPSVSPDGRRLAFYRGLDLFIHDLDRDSETKVPSATRRSDNMKTVWSLDGSRLVFASNRTGNWELHQKRLGTTGPAKLLLAREFSQFPIGTAPDGSIIFQDDTPQGETIWLLPEGQEPRPVFPYQQPASSLTFSADQRFMAYSSREAGREEVYLDTYPPRDGRVQVSVHGGGRPMFSPDGRTLYFTRGQAMMSVELITEGGLQVSPPRQLFSGPYVLDTFDGPSVAPNGKRFLAVRQDPGAIPHTINLVFNWTKELEARLPTH